MLGGSVSFFTINFAQSVFSGFLSFLLCHLLFRRTGVSLLAAFLLLTMPVHLRIAASESMFVTVEMHLLMMLLMFLLWCETSDRVFAVLGAAAAYMLVESRMEMLALAPIFAGLLFIIRPAQMTALLRRRAFWITIGALMMLAVPRTLEIITEIPRNKMYGQVGRAFLFNDETWGPIIIFFNREYTPAILIALFAAGTAWLFLRERRMAVFLSLLWAVPTFVFSKYYFTLSCYMRRTIPIQFVFCILAAVGVHAAAEAARLKPRVRIALFIGAAAAAAAWTSAGYGRYLTREYTMQQEFSFMQKVIKMLPGDATVVLLLEADDGYKLEDGGLCRLYQTRFFTDYANNRKIMGIREFTALKKEGVPRESYFYKGAPCYKFTQYWGAPEHPREDPSYENPLCSAMFSKYALKKVAETTITKGDLSFPIHDVIQGDSRVIGLYKIDIPP
jgi:hypothetical protein